MAVKPSGPLSLTDLQSEYGGSAPISLSEYYRGALTTTNNTGVPASGAIRLSQFYNTKRYIPGSAVFTAVGWNTFTLPTYIDAITVYAVGGGGGGGNAWGDGGCQDQGGAAGGGSSGATYWGGRIGVTPGATISILVGHAGSPANWGGTSGIDGMFYVSGGAPGGGGQCCSYFQNGAFYGGGGSVGSGSNPGGGGYRNSGYQGGSGGSSPWGSGGGGGYGWGGRGENNGSDGGGGSGFGAGGGGAGQNAQWHSGGWGSQGRVEIQW